MPNKSNPTVTAVPGEDALESRLGRLVLSALDAYESKDARGPNAPELATDLGIPLDFGYSHLVAHLERELSLGRVSYYGGRFKLTPKGREIVQSESGTWATPIRIRTARPRTKLRTAV